MPLCGRVLIAVCPAMTTRISRFAQAAEPATTNVIAEAIPSPLPEEWAAEISGQGASSIGRGGCTRYDAADSGWPGSRFHVD